MKTLRSFILTLLLASASLHAMEDATPHDSMPPQIVPFNYEKHHDAAMNLWKKEYPQLAPPTAFSDPITETNIYVLEKTPCADSNSLDTLLGFAVHKPSSLCYSLNPTSLAEIREVSITVAKEKKQFVMSTHDQQYRHLLCEYIAMRNNMNTQALDIGKLLIAPLKHCGNGAPAVATLFQQTLPGIQMPTILSKPSHSTKKNIDLLLKKTDSGDHTLLGFIIYKHHETALLPRGNNPSREKINYQYLRNIIDTSILYLAIDPKYQRQGFGRLLMKHVEHQAAFNSSDYIHLNPSAQTEDFFRKLHRDCSHRYRKFSPYLSGLPDDQGGMVSLRTAKAMTLYTGKDQHESDKMVFD
jgi:GNAT superfamily N-acetyltransferase